MHRITNFTGQARHGWEKMTPAFGMGRQNHIQMPMPSPAVKPPMMGSPMPPMTPMDTTLHLSFNVPLNTNLAGPEVQDVIHSSPGAFDRWTFPEGTPEGTAIHALPVHAANIEKLRKLCRHIAESSQGRVEATITCSEPKASIALQRRSGLVTNVCISGDAEAVPKWRAKILNETPIAMRCAVVELDANLVIESNSKAVRQGVLEHLNQIANWTGCDIFLLGPKSVDADSLNINTLTDGLDQRLRVAIYGDLESTEHAKTRVLIMIDQILRRCIDAIKLERTMQTLVCGRTRRNIKLIESATNTAIYFPPPFLNVFGFTPPGAHRRVEDEVFITGPSKENIMKAKQKLYELAQAFKVYVKDVCIDVNKLDNIMLDRLDKVRKVMEANGSYVLFPPLGSGRGLVRVQGGDVLHVERTVRELMALAGQFYGAQWWILGPDSSSGMTIRTPSPSETQIMLADICANSGADVTFEKLFFTIRGSDDAVKAAMMVISQIPFVKRSNYQIRIKIELANEHKEFVSGKKNGKINKIMGLANVQIIFDGFNDYNFYIDVCANQYDAARHGLDLVEQEMPASIAFHVPDQYHKRIIGIGGQHIQRIMKKYSVFVKFSNAMDRGGVGKDEDDIKVDNVICRTPARNAQNLDLVKQEIMDMVEKADAEFVSERVIIDRLYHRELVARMSEIERLEKKWNCKIDFPSTEAASDVVTISGPEYQVPQAVDAFLRMVPEKHELIMKTTTQLDEFFKSTEFDEDVRGKLKEQYEIDLHIRNDKVAFSDTPVDTTHMLLSYTRNNAGGLKDAIDFLITHLVAHGLDATTVKGAIPRPKSDSFEDSLPFFDSKLLQNFKAPGDSPTRSTFGNDDISERGSFLEKLRKPGSISSISSFLNGRKNQSSSPASSFFKQASSNASKASLVSMESRDSGYRNPWNDSGVNLPEDEALHLNNGWNTSSTTTNSNYMTNFTNRSFDTSKSFLSNNAPVGPGFGGLNGCGVGVLGMGGGGDTTPKHCDIRASFDSGRPSTSNSSLTGYPPAPIGTPR